MSPFDTIAPYLSIENNEVFAEAETADELKAFLVAAGVRVVADCRDVGAVLRLGAAGGEDVEDDVARGRVPGAAAPVPAHESVEVRVSIRDRNELAVEDADGQFAQDVEFGVATGVVLTVLAPTQ